MIAPVHYVGSWLGTHPPRGRTECKIVVWKCQGVKGEANTAENDRIDYAEIWKRVTCEACKCKRRGIHNAESNS